PREEPGGGRRDAGAPAGRPRRLPDRGRRARGGRREARGTRRDRSVDPTSRPPAGLPRLLHERGGHRPAGVRSRPDSFRRVSEMLVIEGGHPLSGRVVPSGNKNAALPILAACLLSDEEIVLENVPDIVDVHVMLALLDDIGVSVRDDGPHRLALDASDIRTTELDPDLCRRL